MITGIIFKSNERKDTIYAKTIAYWQSTNPITIPVEGLNVYLIDTLQASGNASDTRRVLVGKIKGRSVRTNVPWPSNGVYLPDGFDLDMLRWEDYKNLPSNVRKQNKGQSAHIFVREE